MWTKRAGPQRSNRRGENTNDYIRCIEHEILESLESRSRT